MRVLPPFRFIEELVGFPIHTGQWLSIPPFLVGVVLLARALRQRPREPAMPTSPPTAGHQHAIHHAETA
jgi:hypothetical protein